jgi:hypothetical protein
VFLYPLDLFFTNRPSLVNKCLPLPGLSDHDIILADINITPARIKPLKRFIYLWKKVNITNMANNLKVMIYILFGSISVVGDIGPSLSFFLFCDIC